MKKHAFLIILTLILFLTIIPRSSAFAQSEDELDLRLRRDFGYASGNQMQGVFSVRATGPEDLQKVVFYLDGKVLAEDTEAPFSASFSTDSYPMGAHTFSATGYTASGKELKSREIGQVFVTAEEGWQAGAKLIVPILGLVVVVMLVTTFVPIIARGKSVAHLPLGEERRYGAAGGAVCKNCSRPFSLNPFGMNLLTGKLDRCPYCGKWGVQKRLSLPKLREAEQAELKMAAPERAFVQETDEEKVYKEIQESKYTDL